MRDWKLEALLCNRRCSAERGFIFNDPFCFSGNTLSVMPDKEKLIGFISRLICSRMFTSCTFLLKGVWLTPLPGERSLYRLCFNERKRMRVHALATVQSFCKTATTTTEKGVLWYLGNRFTKNRLLWTRVLLVRSMLVYLQIELGWYGRTQSNRLLLMESRSQATTGLSLSMDGWDGSLHTD